VCLIVCLIVLSGSVVDDGVGLQEAKKIIFRCSRVTILTKNTLSSVHKSNPFCLAVDEIKSSTFSPSYVGGTPSFCGLVKYTEL
jgi:hypothetical protein